MNSAVFHEIVNSISIEIARLRPKINIFWKEFNSRLDANGRYTKKIVLTIALVLFLLLFNQGRKDKPTNEFNARAKISISMDDHLKRISEKQQVEADMKYFGESDPTIVSEKEQPVEDEKFSQTKKEFYEEVKNDYDEKYLNIEDVEKQDEVSPPGAPLGDEAQQLVRPTSIDPAQLAANEFEVNFHNPDLSKLPKEIPIPKHYNSDIVPAESEEIRFVEADELPVVEQQGLEEVQHRRQLALRKACYMPKLRTQVYNQTSRFYSVDSLKPDDFRHFIVDDQAKLIYCAVSKAGNTNWKRVMAVLGGAINNKQRWHYNAVQDVPGEPGTPIHEPWFFKRLSEYSMEEITQRLTTRFYRKFTFVRHPFSRILSAYLDKFDGRNTVVADYYMRWYGRYMLKTYQGGKPSQTDPNYKVAWHSFLEYLRDINVTALNEHWERQFSLCHPCHVKFDFVGKLEDAEHEAPYMLDRFRLSGTPGVEYMEGYNSESDAERTVKFFENVEGDILQSLYQKYYWDFKIFGYSPGYAGHPEVDDKV